MERNARHGGCVDGGHVCTLFYCMKHIKGV